MNIVVTIAGYTFLGAVALVVVAVIGYLLLALGRILWNRVDVAMMERITLADNRVNPFVKDTRHPKEDSANKLRDALMESPKLTVLRGFGRVVIIARNTKENGS